MHHAIPLSLVREALAEIERRLREAMADVDAAVSDWKQMVRVADETREELPARAPAADPAIVQECQEFMSWLARDQFIFLGVRDYEVVPGRKGYELRMVPGSGLGILREAPGSVRARPLSSLAEKARGKGQTSPLIITKTNARSTVHRVAHLDYIGVLSFDRRGRTIAERRFLGLFTSSAYSHGVMDTPLIRGAPGRCWTRSVCTRAATPGKRSRTSSQRCRATTCSRCARPRAGHAGRPPEYPARWAGRASRTPGRLPGPVCAARSWSWLAPSRVGRRIQRGRGCARGRFSPESGPAGTGPARSRTPDSPKHHGRPLAAAPGRSGRAGGAAPGREHPLRRGAHRCVVRPGRHGICGVREHRDGRLMCDAYGAVAAVGLEPIEKKPLFHVDPGSLSYSIATTGCPFYCRFCQNWEIAQAPRLGLDMYWRIQAAKAPAK